MPPSDRRYRARMVAAAVLIPALLGACSDMYYDRREGVSFQAGNAVASNSAVQTIDPWPPAAARREIASNGQRVQGAVERYRNNKVTPPQGTDTSSVKYAPVLAAPVASGGSP
jgi:hypothetical protein